jgi:acetyl-CoA C-acetyltransferase
MSTSDPVVIVSAVRTPLGRFQGDLSSFSGHNLGSHAIGAALERAKLSPEQIDEVLMGCVLPPDKVRPLPVRLHAARNCRMQPAQRPLTRCAAPA